MRAFWHPLSALYLDEPRVLAAPAMLRMILAAEGRARVLYAGDGMWPAIRHGQSLTVTPLDAATPALGEVVVAHEGGISDVVRVAGWDGAALVAADACDRPERPVPVERLLGRVEAPSRGGASRALRRWALDLGEAWSGRPDALDDPATTVREKYDAQADFYARSDAPPLERELADRVVESVPVRTRILVAGAGTGREVFALEGMGYEVTGVDFSPRMVARAREEAARRGSTAVFHAAELGAHDEPEASLAAILFTYDVYSFLPSPDARVALLRRMAGWLAPGGDLFLSARRARGARDRMVLSVQWLARALRGRPAAWGDSHTRWLDAGAHVRRSFVHVFTPGGLDAEVTRAGFHCVGWAGGHGHYRVTAGREA